MADNWQYCILFMDLKASSCIVGDGNRRVCGRYDMATCALSLAGGNGSIDDINVLWLMNMTCKYRQHKRRNNSNVTAP